MDFIDKQIAPPKSWEKFEELIRALFAKIWGDPLAQKNGRSGQEQHGVDVYGVPSGAKGTWHGVQCKGKEGQYGAKATVAEFDAELRKAEAFSPGLAHWVFATTAPNDAVLQRHARQVSQMRENDGLFPVVAIGWETIQALMSTHQEIIEAFYPEHSGDFPGILATLRALPTASDIQNMKLALLAVAGSATPRANRANWSEIHFETTRDLGPALMGRPLGPADAVACPVLPETAELLADLERAGSARLAGVAGAGKSICVLQVARKLHDDGWQVLRLDDPTSETMPLVQANIPTLLIVDDAHLSRPSFLSTLEERAHDKLRVLSGHMLIESKENMPGTIQLDARRAVRTIADQLRSDMETTFAAVTRADDRIGKKPGDEQLETRLEHAADVAEFPWQFCFILGGGWRRASALASSSRAARADLVLAAAAIRQLGTRDSRCSQAALSSLIGDSVLADDLCSAIEWLLGQRLLLTSSDLRCPHQRFASVLLMKILDGQTAEGRRSIALVLQRILAQPDVPLGGLATLLQELSSGGDFGKWRELVERSWLTPLIERCWSAATPSDIQQACWSLNAIHGYASDEMAIVAERQQVVVSWISEAPEGACYAIGRLMNHIYNEEEKLGVDISMQVDPAVLARAITAAAPLHACEIAELITMMRMSSNKDWVLGYLKELDRPKLLELVSRWPQDAPLWAVADLCKHFCNFEPEFGFQLIEALIPSIADRLRADPQNCFHELDDIVWHSLRLYDPLDVYTGKRAPTPRMKEVGRKFCACWLPVDLAKKISQSTHRTFQAAAGLLSFLRKSSPRAFKSTVLALDWNVIEQNIGVSWSEGIGDARMLLGVASVVPKARKEIEELIARNESKIAIMSIHTAALAPESAFRHVANGKRIDISNSWHVDWELGALVICHFIEKRRDLIPALLSPHIPSIAVALSQPSPTFYNNALLFLRLIIAAAPDSLPRVLDHIDVRNAAIGWRNALGQRANNRVTGAKPAAQQVAALLVQASISRPDKLGDLARSLRHDFPAASIPLAKTIEPIDLPEEEGVET